MYEEETKNKSASFLMDDHQSETTLSRNSNNLPPAIYRDE